MKNIKEMLKLKLTIEQKEKELREIKKVYDEYYNKVINEIGKNGEKFKIVDDYKVSLVIKKALDIIDYDKVYNYMIKNHPDKMAVDRNKLKALLNKDEKITGAKLIDAVYLVVNKI